MTFANRRSALTLIELLAVIVIVSLIATVATVSLASADQGAALLKAGASLREMDRQGRLHARTTGQPVLLKIDRENNTLLLIDSNLQPLSRVQIHKDVSVHLAGGAAGAEWIMFDRQGHSDDYEMMIESSGSVKRMKFFGLTGFAELQQEVTPG